MAIELIDTGPEPNSREGDSLRLAFTKVNNNFTELDERTSVKIDLVDLQLIVAESSDFEDFKSRIAGL